MTKALSWTPQRVGDIYCSPACGHGCKQVEFNKASRIAATLADTLGGLWRPKVWENLGWFARAESTFGMMYPNRKGGFWCSIVLAGRQFTAERRTPKAALQAALKEAQEASDALAEALDRIKKGV